MIDLIKMRPSLKIVGTLDGFPGAKGGGVVDESLVSCLECHTCSNGLIVFGVDVESDRLLLECEECMTARWQSGEESGFLTIDMLTRPATYDEIWAMGWGLFIRNL
ncbi:hypothetical protein [Streptomyces sp. NPDC056663]|uniref:hypothetical protein n=1 Tax=Streptomyces sp. NPDC056663 TaxID=3345899 RepID=UPI0036879474